MFNKKNLGIPVSIVMIISVISCLSVAMQEFIGLIPCAVIAFALYAFDFEDAVRDLFKNSFVLAVYANIAWLIDTVIQDYVLSWFSSAGVYSNTYRVFTIIYQVVLIIIYVIYAIMLFNAAKGTVLKVNTNGNGNSVPKDPQQ
jgi:hypothetical protein